MKAAETGKTRIFQTGNKPEHIRLCAIFQFGLKAHHIEQCAQSIVLAQLNNSMCLDVGPVRIGEAARFHWPMA